MRQILLLVMIVGCGGKSQPALPDGGGDGSPGVDAAIAPTFRNPVALPDDELALQALQILGADVANAQPESCNGCHGITRQHLSYWRALSETAMTSCLTDLAVGSQASAQQMIDCTRTMPAVTTSDFHTANLGIYASAVRLPWFEHTFRVAYGEANYAAALQQFRDTIGMPRESSTVHAMPFTQAQFDIVAEWFVRGLPDLERQLPPDGQPTSCTPGISASVATHVNALATTGWRQVNQTNMMAMHGCGAVTDPRDCLASAPLGVEQAYGAGWDLAGRGRARVLKDITYRSYFWTRSSASGRFIAHGVAGVAGSYIIDLQRTDDPGTGVDETLIPIANTQYDPSFFPDDGGFMFQGGTVGAKNNTCAMSVLTSNPASVSMSEVGCTASTTVGLYQHVGRALDGDSFAIDSQFTNDNGPGAGNNGPGYDPQAANPDENLDPQTGFDSRGRIDFTPLMFDGTTYVPRPMVHLATPYEGDSVLSPSARLVISRVADPVDRQIGYVLRRVDATQSGNSYTIEVPEIARYCLKGAKPSFSFDERYVVYHHYVENTAADALELGFTGTSDPGFQAYVQDGAANLYLMELTTGATQRLTTMQPGQFALFPHFRSDGWIYADVRDRNTSHEYMIAHDGALILEQ